MENWQFWPCFEFVPTIQMILLYPVYKVPHLLVVGHTLLWICAHNSKWILLQSASFTSAGSQFDMVMTVYLRNTWPDQGKFVWLHNVHNNNKLLYAINWTRETNAINNCIRKGIQVYLFVCFLFVIWMLVKNKPS